VDAALDDPANAALRPEVKAALELLRKMTLEPEQLGADDIVTARNAGLSDEAILDAAEVCAMFNIIDRVADAVSFEVLSPEGFANGAQKLRKFGYAFPPPFRAVMRRA